MNHRPGLEHLEAVQQGLARQVAAHDDDAASAVLSRPAGEAHGRVDDVLHAVDEEGGVEPVGPDHRLQAQDVGTAGGTTSPARPFPVVARVAPIAVPQGSRQRLARQAAVVIPASRQVDQSLHL